MGNYSRRSFITLGGFVISAISSSMLVACSGTSGANDTEADNHVDNDQRMNITGNENYWDSAKGDIPPSNAFNQEGIWYSYGNDYDVATFGSSAASSIAKDESITGIHIFHGDGTATSWFVYDSSGSTKITFSDIDGLTDDEIEEMCPEYWQFDLDAFESQKRDFINYFNDCSQEDGIDYSFIIARAESLDAPQKPSAVPFTLKVKTDDSGNHTQSETLILHQFKSPSAFTSQGRSMLRQYASAGYLDSHPGVLDSMFDTNGEWPFQLTEYAEPKVVYKTTYSGYEHIVLKYNGDAEFVLDTPDADGIEVD